MEKGESQDRVTTILTSTWAVELSRPDTPAIRKRIVDICFGFFDGSSGTHSHHGGTKLIPQVAVPLLVAKAKRFITTREIRLGSSKV